MDKQLIGWFVKYHINDGKRVTTKNFRKKALEFSNDSKFKASKGWLQNLRKRYNVIKLNE